MSKAVSIASGELETAKTELSAASTTQADGAKAAAVAAVANLRKDVNKNKAAAVAALKDAAEKNVKARALISDGVKEVRADIDAVLACNSERKLYVFAPAHPFPLPPTHRKR